MRWIFFNNYLLMLPLLAWAAAQLIKTGIAFFASGKFKAERLFGAGGWPSSHSALVCALFIGAAPANFWRLLTELRRSFRRCVCLARIAARHLGPR